MQDLSGSTLGPYTLEEPIGAGGMSTVYRALHRSLKRTVAIKVLPPYMQHDTQFYDRFRREAAAVARLDHPNILTVHDFGQDNGIAYLVMEYVSGGTLRDIMKAGLPIDVSVELIRQLASALDHAHAQGIVHRDVKPGNILIHGLPPGVAPEDAVNHLDPEHIVAKLADFGLAKAMDGGQTVTKTGIGLGTPEYISPEQGQGIHVDGRSDIYSLGVVAYELLVGRRPFEANTPLAVVFAHLNAAPPPVAGLRPDLPPTIEPVLLRALAKRPEDRYQSAGEFAADLVRAVSAPEPVAAVAAPPARSKGKFLVAAAGVGVLVIAAAIGGALVVQPKEAPAAAALECMPGPFAVTVRQSTPSPSQNSSSTKVDPALETAWNGMKVRMGEPRSQPFEVPVIRQKYERGKLVLRNDARRIIAMFAGQDNTGRFAIFGDLDRSEDRIEFGRPPSANLMPPSFQFARVWRNNNLEQPIGWATDLPLPVSSAVCQDFKNGFMLGRLDGQVVAYFNDSSYLAN